jgi:hypothetical protein
MGVDGNQYIAIRGSKEILNTLEQCSLKLDDLDEKCTVIAERFFGPHNIVLKLRDPNYLVIATEFRNKPIYEYMEMLLKRYPTLWIKNDYSGEDGSHGFWIGRYRNGEVYIQTHTWEELTNEEIMMATDFSR